MATNPITILGVEQADGSRGDHPREVWVDFEGTQAGDGNANRLGNLLQGYGYRTEEARPFGQADIWRVYLWKSEGSVTRDEIDTLLRIESKKRDAKVDVSWIRRSSTP